METRTPPAGTPAAAGRMVVWSGWPRVLWIAGAVLLGVMLFHVVALAVTGGPVTGPVSLRKPATFAETGWLVCWSVALVLPRLRTRPAQRGVIGAATVAFGVVETTTMAIQAWRGVPSHYNFTTPLDSVLMFGGAAGTAGIFLIGVVVLIVATVRSRGASRAVRLGVLAGAVVLLAACLIGLVMISNSSGVFQGAIGANRGRPGAGYLGPSAATVGRQYLLLRPFTHGGDLVLPHAIGVHGLLLLAVPAVLLSGTSAGARRQVRIVAGAVAGIAVAMAVLLFHAFRQQPLSRLGPVELVVLGACAAVTLASYAAVVHAMWRSRPAAARRAAEPAVPWA